MFDLMIVLIDQNYLVIKVNHFVSDVYFIITIIFSEDLISDDNSTIKTGVTSPTPSVK